MLNYVIFWHERSEGLDRRYWWLYIPLGSVHVTTAATTSSLGGYILQIGLHRIRYGRVDLMSSSLSLYRRLGRLLVWAYSGTMTTACLVHLMLSVLSRSPRQSCSAILRAEFLLFQTWRPSKYTYFQLDTTDEIGQRKEVTFSLVAGCYAVCTMQTIGILGNGTDCPGRGCQGR